MERTEMSLSFLQCLLRKIMAVALICIFPVSIWAQDAPAAQTQPSGSSSTALPQAPSSRSRSEIMNYSKPQGYFPNPIAPYSPREVAPPDLTNSPRLDQLMREGKIYLSMDDAVALALENNLDIAIQRYNLGIADTDVMRTQSGSNTFFGVNFGVVQNTPGGGVGGLNGNVGSGPGGTSSGAGGVGAGTVGFTSTEGLGPIITSFDPIISGTLQFDHNNTIANNIFAGAPIARQGTTTADFNYQQGFHSGTNLLIGFNNSRIGTNSSFNTYSPGVNSSFQVRV